MTINLDRTKELCPHCIGMGKYKVMNHKLKKLVVEICTICGGSGFVKKKKGKK